MDGSAQRHKRSRDGCWTCRKRKKKCDDSGFPCKSCARLNLECERGTKLVWEDDRRRSSISKRGPATTPSKQEEAESDSDAMPIHGTWHNVSTHNFEIVMQKPVPKMKVAQSSPKPTNLKSVSQWPFRLDATESQLMDHYIQRFSRTYPTFSSPTNPFLRILLPLSMQSRVVLDSLLALSAVQSWQDGAFTMQQSMLRFRHKALHGCMKLLETANATQIQNETIVASAASGISTDDTVYLLSACVMLLLYEKLAGEGQDNWTPHIEFFSKLFPGQILKPGSTTKSGNVEACMSSNEALQFLLNIFLYNDLVRSTTLKQPTLSQFYVQPPESVRSNDDGRFTFPRIIARMGMGDETVTDDEIAAWDGRLDWFPSFALESLSCSLPTKGLPTNDWSLIMDPQYAQLASVAACDDWIDHKLMAELYRIAATIYKQHNTRRFGGSALANDMEKSDLQMGNLPLWATQLIQRLPEGSPLKNALLWPISITASELDKTKQTERQVILSRLVSLEKRFQMKHFQSMQQHLRRIWDNKDRGLSYYQSESALFG